MYYRSSCVRSRRVHSSISHPCCRSQEAVRRRCYRRTAWYSRRCSCSVIGSFTGPVHCVFLAPRATVPVQWHLQVSACSPEGGVPTCATPRYRGAAQDFLPAGGVGANLCHGEMIGAPRDDGRARSSRYRRPWSRRLLWRAPAGGHPATELGQGHLAVAIRIHRCHEATELRVRQSDVQPGRETERQSETERPRDRNKQKGSEAHRETDLINASLSSLRRRWPVLDLSAASKN
eukprot:COSAG03_NODE_8561_length_792_cov_1.210678_1_plen_232_part_01